MAKFQGWWPFTRYSNWGAAHNGKRDAKYGIPEENQEKQPAYVLQLKQVAEENIERLSQGWKQQDGVFLTKYCKAKSSLNHLQGALIKAEQEGLDARNAERAARDEYVKYMHLAPAWYLFLLVAIAILELPLNSIVFQLFGESKTLTLLMSIGLGIMLPASAHFVGGLLRHGFLRAGKVTTETVLIVSLVLATVGSLAGIAYFRENFFEGSGVQKLLGLTMDATTVTVVFFIINLLIFMVATVASYVAHDSMATRHLLDLKAAAKLRKNAERRIALTQTRLQQTAAELHEVTSQRQKAFEHARHRIDELRNIVQRVISIYEQYNQRHRGSAKKPVCFEHYPEINTRDPDLDPRKSEGRLDWSCEATARPEASKQEVPPSTVPATASF